MIMLPVKSVLKTNRNSVIRIYEMCLLTDVMQDKHNLP